jgi:large subunit ribosomal protein L15
MNLSNLKPVEGSTHAKKRVGRGIGSGHGKTATRGSKGQNSRTSGGVRTGYEGGQTMLFKRIPKRGFTSFTKVEYAIVNLQDLSVFKDGETVSKETLVAKKIIKKSAELVKILGVGELTVKIKVIADKFTKSAEAAIKAAGGEVEVAVHKKAAGANVEGK